MDKLTENNTIFCADCGDEQDFKGELKKMRKISCQEICEDAYYDDKEFIVFEDLIVWIKNYSEESEEYYSSLLNQLKQNVK